MTNIRALIIVDVQVDFCPAGALATVQGSEVAKKIAAYVEDSRQHYNLVVTTQDWHIDPGNHFATEPDFVDTWPVHCVAESEGARLHPFLQQVDFDAQFHKGQHSAAYSGFEGTEATTGESLHEFLLAKQTRAVDIVGIATDHCVKATALDAIKNGYSVRILAPLCAPVDEAQGQAALNELAAAGADIVADVEDHNPWA